MRERKHTEIRGDGVIERERQRKRERDTPCAECPELEEGRWEKGGGDSSALGPIPGQALIPVKQPNLLADITFAEKQNKKEMW